MEKVRKAIFMFVDLFGVERYNFEKLVNFMVTVKTNYRSVVYHNWSHGFHVANSIYSILKASPGIYTPYEVIQNTIHELFGLFYDDSVLDCGLAPFVTTLITAASTTSS